MEVRLRQVERTDLAQLRDWRNQEQIRMRAREYRMLNMDHQISWFDQIQTSSRTEMFVILVGEESALEWAGMHWTPVGVCGLCHIDWINRHAEVSIYIGPEEWQHKGVGTEVLHLLAKKAFSEFNLIRLWAEVYQFNESSVRLFEKCGYTREGTLRNHIIRGGIYTEELGWETCFYDAHIYGLLREDFVQD